MFSWIKEEIINYEQIEAEEDIVLTIDCEEDISYDIVSIDKHSFSDYTETLRGFEVYKYRRDGSGDYEPIETKFNVDEVYEIYKELKCQTPS